MDANGKVLTSLVMVPGEAPVEKQAQMDQITHSVSKGPERGTPEFGPDR